MKVQRNLEYKTLDIGRFQVEIQTPDIIDQTTNEKYGNVLITEFDEEDKELGHKRFYLKEGQSLRIKSEQQIEALFNLPENTKLLEGKNIPLPKNLEFYNYKIPDTNITLGPEGMLLIHKAYELASKAEYIYESNPELSVDDAKKIAEKVTRLMDKYGYEEEKAIADSLEEWKEEMESSYDLD